MFKNILIKYYSFMRDRNIKSVREWTVLLDGKYNYTYNEKKMFKKYINDCQKMADKYDSKIKRLRTGKSSGECVICKGDTAWSYEINKYKRFCDNPKCKEKYIKMMKEKPSIDTIS